MLKLAREGADLAPRHGGGAEAIRKEKERAFLQEQVRRTLACDARRVTTRPVCTSGCQGQSSDASRGLCNSCISPVKKSLKYKERDERDAEEVPETNALVRRQKIHLSG
jgi:hypothetical protein